MKLGAIYSKGKTTFTLFSPVADSVFVIFYDKGNDSAETGRLEMVRGEGELRSIFSATAEGNLNGVYYTYEVHTPDGTFSSHDPYARACGVNGHRSMVIDLSKTDPDGFADEDRPKLADPMSMVITEVSIADVSADASAHSRYPGKFKAFTEDKILSYFKDMGVTHLQLMPSYDFASIDESDSLKEQYNWGYDPYNYNVPEGSYSTDPFNGAVRVREYKEMVHSIHEAGLGVIMDVVYNHTFNVHDSCFYKTAGNYFYRMLDAAKYSDASACGNEIASEKPMVRKYIIDSLCYWASEYHIDGFRFDLMGVLDIETLNEARKALLKINPDIIMYGEGWTGGESTLPESERGMKIQLDMYQTLAVAVLVLLLGNYLKKKIYFLQKFCIPAPVIGGLIFAIMTCICYVTGIAEFSFDDTLREVCMVFFFTSVGFQANLKVLKSGGKSLIVFLGLVIVLIILQNLTAVGLAKLLNLNPLIGMCTGSIPMVGGHGTAGAFGPVLEDLNIKGATTICTAAATFGLIFGSLIGGPLGKRLIEKHSLLNTTANEDDSLLVEDEKKHERHTNMYADAVFQLILAIGVGTIFTMLLTKTGLTFPIYIGAMLAAALMRNICEYTGIATIHMGEINDLGGISLSLFLGMAMITLRLWELASLALPLFILLAAQVLLIIIFTYVIEFNIMGRDYDAAILVSGTCGFGTGATPNAMANMQAVCDQYVPSIKAYLLIPLVGSLFADFLNSLVITFFINLL